MDPIDRLVEEYSEYLTAHALPSMSADELIVELTERGDRAHHAWLGDFIVRWDTAMGEENKYYPAPEHWGQAANDSTVMPLASWRDAIPENEDAARDTVFHSWYRDAKEAYEDHEDEVYISWPEYREELFNELVEVK